jgi:hypothetical protein
MSDGNYGGQRPDFVDLNKDNNLPGNNKTVMMGAVTASVLPPGANHVLKAIGAKPRCKMNATVCAHGVPVY